MTYFICFVLFSFHLINSAATVEQSTDCHGELESMRYEKAIAAEFPSLENGRPSIVPRGFLRNLFCRCDRGSPTWMTCSISCESPELRTIVEARLDTENQDP